MARVRDMWWSEVPKKGPDGKNVLDDHGLVVTVRKKTKKHPDNGGNKNAKRFLAVWINPEGNEATKAFAQKTPAQKYADRMEADAVRGDYLDPDAAKEKFGPLAEKYLRLHRKRDGSRPGGSTQERTMSVYRNHVGPAFADRGVQAVKASEVKEWLQTPPLSELGSGTRVAAYNIVAGTFDLAVADRLRRDNPARSKIVNAPRLVRNRREAWTVERTQEMRDALPEAYRALVDCSAGLGARQAEAFGLAEGDFDWEAERVQFARQVRRVGKQIVFQLPKGGKTRTVPLPRGTALAVRAHLAGFPAVPVTLPWMDGEGKIGGEVTARLLFTWQPSKYRKSAGLPLKFGNFDQDLWKPALAALGVIPPPVKTGNRDVVYKVGDAKGNGQHVLRHVYDTMLADGGVPLAGIMEFMGHSPGSFAVTVGTYGHATEETFEAARQAVDARLYKLRPVKSSGAVTELRAVE